MKKVVFIMVALMSGLLMFSSCSETKKDKKVSTTPKKEIYLQLYSLRDDIKADYSATIAKAAEIGYTGIEAAGYNEGQFYDMSPIDFKKSIEDVGMEVLSSHAGRPLAEPASDTNWEETWAWWDTAIQAHKDAGMKYLVVA